jgi:hypothetical protein
VDAFNHLRFPFSTPSLEPLIPGTKTMGMLLSFEFDIKAFLFRCSGREALQLIKKQKIVKNLE